MAISTTTEKNSLATKYGTDAAYVTLFTTAPSGGTPGTEFSGSRVAVSWGAPSNGAITASATLNVNSGQTINGVGLYSASTGGTYVDGATVSSQAFSSNGTYTVSLTYTQS